MVRVKLDAGFWTAIAILKVLLLVLTLFDEALNVLQVVHVFLRLLLGKGSGLAIAHACDVTDEATFLVGDAYFNGGNLMVIAYADSFSLEQVPLFGTRHKHDAVADTKGQLSLIVHQRSDGQVC